MIHNENKPGEQLIKELKELKQKYADLQSAYKKSSARNKQSDERNRLALKEWQSTFDAIEDIVILINPDHEIIKANKVALEALNQTPDEIAGKKCYHIVHNTNSPILGCPCEEACKEKRSVIKEYFQNGRFYELSAWPVFDENNNVVWFTHVVKDITERKQAEQALIYQSQMQELLRKIAFDFINVKLEDVDRVIQKSLKDVGEFVKADRVYVFDYDWKNNVCSNTYEWCRPGIQPQIAEMQGVPLDAIPHWVNTHKQGKIMHIPDVFALPENDVVRQILEQQEIKSLITIPIMDGQECIGFLGFDSVKEHHRYNETEEGVLAVLAQMFVNISHHKHAEREQYKMMHAIEQSPVSIFITGLEGNIEYVNPKTLEITGYTKEELIGKNPRIFNSGEKPKEEYKIIWSTILSGNEWRGEFHNKKKNGDLYWEYASISPILNEKNKITNFVAVKEDITERKKFIEDLKTEKENAQAADRLKTAFLNNISHEVRTPLNGILGFGQMMAEGDLSKEEKEMYLKILKQSSDRLINTITDFMDISLIASGNVTVNKKIFPIAPLLNELGELYGAQCKEKGLEFKLSLPPDTEKADVESDAGLLKKVFMHLLNNAMKFTGEGTIKLGYRLKQDSVECFVGDTGKGIDAEMQDMVFAHFTQEDTRIVRGYEGSGLGLSITKGLMELLGGEISLKSEKGKGTTVSFTLPRTEKNIDQENTGSKKQPAVGHVVLIAEDDYMNRLFMETILKKAGIQYVSVEDGQEAVEQCRDNPDIDLVLMDLKMPVMDGLEATRQIKAFKPELPIIAITAQAMHGDKQKALDAGCDDYVAKPIKTALLIQKIKRFNQVLKP